MNIKRRMQADAVLSVSDLIPRLGVSRQTIIREIESKRLPASRVRWQYRIKVADVEKYERVCRRVA